MKGYGWFLGVAACLMLMGGGCASMARVYKLYPGPHPGQGNLATIRLVPGTALIIDGFNVSAAEYQSVDVLPGRHRLANGFGYSILASRDTSDWYEADACAAEGLAPMLAAGNEYRLRYGGNELELQDVETRTIIWSCGDNR